MDRLRTFFVDSFPAKEMILWGFVPALVWAYVCLAVCGYLKVKRGVRTGYTRKVFHFAIFATVAGVHALWGVQGGGLFGGMTSLVVLYGLSGEGEPAVRGDGA